MKKSFKEWDDLMNDIKSDIDDVLSEEVFDEVRDIEIEHIQLDVFNQYTLKFMKDETPMVLMILEYSRI